MKHVEPEISAELRAVVAVLRSKLDDIERLANQLADEETDRDGD